MIRFSLHPKFVNAKGKVGNEAIILLEQAKPVNESGNEGN